MLCPPGLPVFPLIHPMYRFLLLLLLSVLPSAFGQQATPYLVNRPVLKALPLGGDEEVPSKPAQTLVPEPVVMPSPLDTRPVGDDAVRLQIFLDEANFGPGVIDGKPGRFTELAARSWNEVNGHPVDDWIALNTAEKSSSANPLPRWLARRRLPGWTLCSWTGNCPAWTGSRRFGKSANRKKPATCPWS